MTSTCCLLHWAIILIPSSCLISSIWQSWSSPILEILSSFGLQDTTFSWFSSYLTSHFFSVFFCWLLLSSSFHFGKILGFLLFIISPLIMLPRYILSNTNHTLTPPKCRSPVWLSLLNTNLVHPTLSQLLGSLIAMSKVKLLIHYLYSPPHLVPLVMFCLS